MSQGWTQGNEVTLGWAAGILDGEGSIYIGATHRTGGRSYWRLRVDVTNTDPRITGTMLALFGGNVCVRKRRPTHKPATVWQIEGPGAIRCLRQLAPCLVSKRERAELALRFAQTLIGLHDPKRLPLSLVTERSDMAASMALLNKKGA